MPLTAASRALKRHEPTRFTRSPRDCAGHKNRLSNGKKSTDDRHEQLLICMISWTVWS